jgi:hypothetical protein
MQNCKFRDYIVVVDVFEKKTRTIRGAIHGFMHYALFLWVFLIYMRCKRRCSSTQVA